MQTPELASISKMFRDMFLKSIIKVQDVRVEFGRIIDAADIASEQFDHDSEATICEDAVLIRAIYIEVVIIATMCRSEEVKKRWVNDLYCLSSV